MSSLEHSDSTYFRGQQQIFMGLLFVHWAQRWKGVDLVDCNAVGGGQITTSINQSVNKYQRHSRWKNTNNQLLYSLYCETPKDW